MSDSSELPLERLDYLNAGQDMVRWSHEGHEYSASVRISGVTAHFSDGLPLLFTLRLQLSAESVRKAVPFMLRVSTEWANGDFPGRAWGVDLNSFGMVSQE